MRWYCVGPNGNTVEMTVCEGTAKDDTPPIQSLGMDNEGIIRPLDQLTTEPPEPDKPPLLFP